MTARTEFALAQKLRPRKVFFFSDLEALREDLISSINDYRREQSEFLIGDFNAATFKAGDAFFFADFFLFSFRQRRGLALCGICYTSAGLRGALRV